MTLRFKVGDMVIVTHYYENIGTEKEFIKRPEHIKNVILNKIPLRIEKIIQEYPNEPNKNMYKLENNPSDMWERELEFAKITNWKERII